MGDFFLCVLVLSMVGTLVLLMGVFAWSEFEETKLGSYIIDKLTKRREENGK